MQEYDYVIIGSGFGGSVSALRLTEKGHKTAVVEQGGWITPDVVRRADEGMNNLMWMPGLNMHGFFRQSVFRHVVILGGVSVGGGSTVYAAVLMKPKKEFFTDPAWSGLSHEWEKELAPHYETASRMLGVTPNPHRGLMDDYLEQIAEAMGAAMKLPAESSKKTKSQLIGMENCFLLTQTFNG